MLDEEKKNRADLAKNFQDRMFEVQEEINDLKNTRVAEVEKNQAVRNQIQEQVTEYKAKEE